MTNLKRIRQSFEISQAELSEISGVNLRTLQYYEQGYKDINKAQAITLYELAQVLRCNIEDLLENIDKTYGEWESIGDWLLACSNCDEVIKDNDTGEYPKYCPHCGKEMLPFKK